MVARAAGEEEKAPAEAAPSEGSAGGAATETGLEDFDFKNASKVGRCKLDPSLKAPRFQIFMMKKVHSAFNLNPCFLSLRHYTKEQWTAIITGAVSVALAVARRCKLTLDSKAPGFKV